MKTRLLCLSMNSNTFPNPVSILIWWKKVVWNTLVLGFNIVEQFNSFSFQNNWMLNNLWRISLKVTVYVKKLNFSNTFYFHLTDKQLYKLKKLIKPEARFIYIIDCKKAGVNSTFNILAITFCLLWCLLFLLLSYTIPL